MTRISMTEWLKNHADGEHEVEVTLRHFEGTDYTVFTCDCGSSFELDAVSLSGRLVRLGGEVGSANTPPEDNPCVLCYRTIDAIRICLPDKEVIIKAGEEVLVSVRPDHDELYWIETVDKRVTALVGMDELEEA